MWLVLGLGNPGPEYAGTRHNVGFAVVERLAARHGITLSRERHQARFGRGKIGREECLLAEPQTYMNLSGGAARALLSFHSIDPDHLIVVHDEADFAPGLLRLKRGGGVAGHNGLTSLLQHLGTTDFIRLRVGIGRPEAGAAAMSQHVLSRPTGPEAEAIAQAIERAADAVEAILDQGFTRAMGTFNRAQVAGTP